jgi:hypothetical protein
MDIKLEAPRKMLAEADFLLHELTEALPTDTRRLVAQAVHKLVHDVAAAISDNPEIRGSQPTGGQEERPACKHEWHEHCDTDINAAGVHREYWRECTKCGEAQGDEGEPIEQPHADCEGCGQPDCPCNRVEPPSVGQEPKCKYCGNSADHKCGYFHACGDCCGNHGELARADRRLYEWVRDNANAHGRLQVQLSAALGEVAEWERTIVIAGCVRDASRPCGWRNSRVEKAESELASLREQNETMKSALKSAIERIKGREFTGDLEKLI